MEAAVREAIKHVAATITAAEEEEE